MGISENHPLHHIPVAPFDPEEGITVLGIPLDVTLYVASGTQECSTASNATISILKNFVSSLVARSDNVSCDIAWTLAGHPLDVSKVPGRRDHLRRVISRHLNQTHGINGHLAMDAVVKRQNWIPPGRCAVLGLQLCGCFHHCLAQVLPVHPCALTHDIASIGGTNICRD